MEHTAKDPSQIKGWGVDADPKNDPTYPMKLRNDGEQAGYSWDRPPQQPLTVEVLHSNERPDLTSVFGTSVPPSGPSGALRRLAFKYSESSYGHWLPLVLADRLSVVGGVLGDLKQGRVPNVFAERGWKAEWEHNRSALLRRIILRAVIAFAAVAYYRRRGADSRVANPVRGCHRHESPDFIEHLSQDSNWGEILEHNYPVAGGQKVRWHPDAPGAYSFVN